MGRFLFSKSNDGAFGEVGRLWRRYLEIIAGRCEEAE